MAALEEAVAAGPSGPYKFLDYYGDSQQDQRRFGGREREVREIVARITNSRTFVLYGRSGIGKTSLLLAGIFPALRERGYQPVYVRTLTSPLADLYSAVAEQCRLPMTPDGDLRRLVRRTRGERPIALVLDQFEEFFIRFRDRPEERAAFVAALAEALRDRSLDLSVIWSLREDYLARLDDFLPEIPDLFANELRLKPLTAFGVRQAISLPLVDSGIPYEEAVVSKLVDQLAELGFDPPVLQILCAELYKETGRRAAGGAPRITLADLERVGGLEGIFRRYLDGLAEAIPETQHLLARMVLDALITRDSTKQAATLEDLLAARFSAAAGETQEVLDRLVHQRLLRREAREGKDWYELIHERLVPIVKEWLDLDRQFFEFRQARAFVHNNSESDLWRKNPEALLNAGVLADLIAPYQERFRFDGRELEFVFRSLAFRRAPGIRFWAERLGAEPAISLLQQLAASQHRGERLGAMEAAAEAPGQDPRLAATCLQVALADPDQEVRRAAGLALAKLATPVELQTLQELLRQRAHRKRAREVLVHLRMGGHALAGFSWLRRRLASDGAEGLAATDQKTWIREHRKSGIVSGTVAGMTWSLTVGVGLAAIFAALAIHDITSLGDWLKYTALFAAVGFCASTLLGALLGALASGATAKDAAVHGEGRLPVALLRNFGLFCFFMLPALAAACLVQRGSFDSRLSVALWLFLGLVSFVLWASLVHLGCSCVRSNPSAIATLLWSLIWSAGPALLVSWVAAATFIALETPLAMDFGSVLGLTIEDLRYVCLVGAALLSSISCTALSAIARSSRKVPLRPLAELSPGRAAFPLRFAAAIAVLLVPAWFFGFYGGDCLPLFAPVIDYKPPKDLRYSYRFGPGGVPYVHYVSIRNATDKAQVVNLHSEGNGSVDLAWSSQPLGLSTSILLLEPGNRLSRSEINRNPGGNRRISLSLAPLWYPRFGADSQIPLGDLHPGPIGLTFSPVPGSPLHWQSRITILAGSTRPAFLLKLKQLGVLRKPSNVKEIHLSAIQSTSSESHRRLNSDSRDFLFMPFVPDRPLLLDAVGIPVSNGQAGNPQDIELLLFIDFGVPNGPQGGTESRPAEAPPASGEGPFTSPG